METRCQIAILLPRHHRNPHVVITKVQHVRDYSLYEDYKIQMIDLVYQSSHPSGESGEWRASALEIARSSQATRLDETLDGAVFAKLLTSTLHARLKHQAPDETPTLPNVEMSQA